MCYGLHAEGALASVVPPLPSPIDIVSSTSGSLGVLRLQCGNVITVALNYPVQCVFEVSLCVNTSLGVLAAM